MLTPAHVLVRANGLVMNACDLGEPASTSQSEGNMIILKAAPHATHFLHMPIEDSLNIRWRLRRSSMTL